MINKRKRLSGLVGVCLIGLAGSAWVAAQDHPTAEDLLEKGLAQLEEGNLEKAETTLKRIDAIQLDPDDRVKLNRALVKLEMAEGKKEGKKETAKKARASQKEKGGAQPSRDVPVPVKPKKAAALPKPEKPLPTPRREMKVAEAEKAKEKAKTAEEEGKRKEKEVPRPAKPEKAAPVAKPEKPLPTPRREMKVAEAKGEPKSKEPKPEPEEEPTKVAEKKEKPQPPKKPSPVTPPSKPSREQPAQKKKAAEEAEPTAGDGLMAKAKKIRVQELITQAKKAADDGQYNLAANKYRQALSIQPENQEAKKGLKRVQSLLAEAPGEQLIKDVGESIRLRRQEAKARFRERMERAKEAKRAGNYEQAKSAVAVAKQALKTHRDALEPPTYRKLLQRAEREARRIAQLKKKKEAAERRKQEKIAKREEEKRQQRAKKERQRKVSQLLKRVHQLQRELKYKQALDVLDRILSPTLDPDNVAAKALRRVIKDAMLYRNFDDQRKKRRQEAAKQSRDNLKATIPHTEIIRYPPDWPEITRKRLNIPGVGGQGGQGGLAKKKLEKPVPVDLAQTDLKSVVDFLRESTDAKIHVNWRALESAGIARDTEVTLNLGKVPAKKALELALDQASTDLAKVSYAVEDGVVNVSTSQNLAENTVTKTYEIGDLLAKAPDFKEVPEFDLTKITQEDNQDDSVQLTRGGSGQTSGSSSARSSSGSSYSQPPKSGSTQLARRQALIDEVMNLVRDTVAPNQWRANGGMVSSMRQFKGTLIVSAPAGVQGRVSGLLDELREARAVQISVESRFLTVTQNFLNEIGIDLDATIPSSELGSDVGDITLRQNSANVASAGGTGISGSFTGSSPGSLASGTNPSPTNVGAPTGRSFELQTSFLSDLEVNLLIRATAADRRATNLSAPRLTFHNGQTANIVIANQIGFVSSLDPVVAESSVAFTPTIDFAQSGVTMEVTGTVSADRRYVTLTIQPSLADVTRPIRTVAVSAAVGGGGDGGGDGGGGDGDGTAIATGFIEVPEQEITQIQTTVTVPDKGTVMLGGQRIRGEVQTEVGVPILSKVPLLNRLVTNRSTVKDERTLLVLVKPTILIQSEREREWAKKKGWPEWVQDAAGSPKGGPRRIGVGQP